jgi:hypothetical protein
MAAASDYLELKILEHTLGITSFTAPTTTYLALFTSDPTDAGTGTEVSGGSYARQSISWNTPASGATTNSADVTFPQATGNYGTVTHIGIYDASSSGNLLYHGALSASKSVETNDTFIVEAGDLSVSLD